MNPETGAISAPAPSNKVLRTIEEILHNFEVPCEFVTPDGERLRIGSDAPVFRMILNTDRVIANGANEFSWGRAFVNGEFDIEGDMMRFFDIRNHLKNNLSLMTKLKLLGQLIFQAPTWINRKAISHHYEFGDEFFLCFMDTDYHLYSHGFFNADDEPLEKASERKLETMFEWTALKPGMRVLDIGAGWGGVTRYCGPRDVHVTSLTLAQDSYSHITKLLEETSYPGQVLLEDFLEHKPEEPYDAIVILGVIEHIPYYRRFFQQAWDLLKPGGRIYMDASADIEKFAVSQYIRDYIYPGTHSYMCLQDVLQEMLFHGFMPEQVVQDNHNYMLTMRHWAERFEKNKDMICKRWDEQVYRAFWLYLWSGAYAFGNNVLQAYHLVAERTEDAGLRPGTVHRASNFVRGLF